MKIRNGLLITILAAAFFSNANFTRSADQTQVDAVEKCLRIPRFGDMHYPYKPNKGDVVLALGLLGDERAVPVLLEHLAGEPNDHLRVQIARALGWIRSNKAVPTLKEATMKDRYLHARKAAAEALREITGIEHSYDRTGDADARKRAFEALEASRLEREKKANK